MSMQQISGHELSFASEQSHACVTHCVENPRTKKRKLRQGLVRQPGKLSLKQSTALRHWVLPEFQVPHGVCTGADSGAVDKVGEGWIWSTWSAVLRIASLPPPQAIDLASRCQTLRRHHVFLRQRSQDTRYHKLQHRHVKKIA